MKTFYKFNVFSLIYMILVIGWGAFVRATGSGAGCGEHWPLCNGEVLPRAERIQTVIEFTHRATSGVSLILAVIAFFWSRKIAPKGSAIRTFGAAVLGMIIIEALLGAGLVLLKLVEFDQSAARAVSISLHSVNTLLLLSAVATLTWLTRPNAKAKLKGFQPLTQDRFFWTAFTLFLVLAMSGAITALGDTLFPSASLKEGMANDFSAGAHFLIQLRVIHPVLAFLWIFIAFLWSKKLEDFRDTPVRSLLLLGVTTQLILGMMNWVLMAPTWLQIVHLMVADLVFITFWISGLEYEVRKSPQQT